MVTLTVHVWLQYLATLHSVQVLRVPCSAPLLQAQQTAASSSPGSGTVKPRLDRSHCTISRW